MLRQWLPHYSREWKISFTKSSRHKSSYEFSLTGQQAHDLIAAANSIHTLTPYAQKAVNVIKERLSSKHLYEEPVVYYHSYDQIDTNVYKTIVEAIKSRNSLNLSYLPARKESQQASTLLIHTR